MLRNIFTAVDNSYTSSILSLIMIVKKVNSVSLFHSYYFSRKVTSYADSIKDFLYSTDFFPFFLCYGHALCGYEFGVIT